MYIDYGDFTAHTPTGDFEFKPSLKNISSIGTPADIVNIFSKVHMISFNEWLLSLDNCNESIATKAFLNAKNTAFLSSLAVLRACCDVDISSFIGKWEAMGQKVHGKFGSEKNQDKLIALAKHLLLHGVIGKTERKADSKNTRASKEFKASEIVAMARDKNILGLSREEAWSLTMTEFVMQVDLLIPTETSDNGAPTDDEYDSVMQMLADIDKKGDK